MKTLVIQTHVKMEALVTMASVPVNLDALESIVKHAVSTTNPEIVQYFQKTL